MGFYGNITNTSNTTFSFDRIYPNRLTMDANANNDGIFIGRYVLIEYQEKAAYPVAYHATLVAGSNTQYYFYSSTNKEEISKIKYLGPAPDEPEHLPSIDDINAIYQDGFYEGEILQYYIYSSEKKDWIFSEEFYKCTGGIDGYAIFEKILTPEMKSDYIQNFEIDENHYGQNSKGFKGYDSTVWVKSSVEQNGKLITKYVSIADLNSVVPTFDIAADAPTMTPITPHFDADSTNVYYKLHAQPQWGFRIAKADTDKSDENTQWIREFYNPNNDTSTKKYASSVTNGIPDWGDDSTATLPAAIYFNEDGFKKQLINTDERQGEIKKHSTTVIENTIKVEPTGKSGIEYNTHNGSNGPSTSVQVDTQELTINLPAIGNMMSDAWDIIHGPNRDNARTDENSSLQGRLDSFEAFYDNQIPVKQIGGTIIGSKINNAEKYDDWEYKPLDILDDNTNPNFERDDAWIRTEISTTNLKSGDKNSEDDQSGNSGISIHHTFHKTNDSTTQLDKNTGEAQQNLDYKSQHISAIRDQDGNIISSSINSENGNKDDYIKLYTPYVDAMGHVVGKNIETIKLPYGYKSITIANDGDIVNAAPGNMIGTQTANNTQDNIEFNTSNKWIVLDKTNENDVVKFGHLLTSINTQANNDYGLSANMSVTEVDNNDNKFNVPVFQFDKAGHVTKAETHTVSLPNGFTTYSSTTSSIDSQDNTVGTSGNIIPDTMTDTIVFAEGNQWINITAVPDDNKFIFSHYVKDFNKANNIEIDFNNSTTNTITLTNWEKDKAGHLISGQDTIYTLPNAIKTLTIANSGVNSTESTTATSGNLVADKLVDTMTIDTGNRWIVLSTDIANDKVSFYHAAPNSNSSSTNTTNANNNSAKTLNFNSNFEIPQVKYDETGHIFGVSKHTITLDGTNNLTLSNYSKGSSKDAIATNETLNGAFGKLENRLDTLQADSTTEGSVAYQIAKIVNENGNGSIDTLNEIAAWIINDTTGAAKMANDIATLKDIDTVSGSVANSIKIAIEGLDSSKSADANKYISGITITDGKITDIQQTTLGSAAYKNEEYFAKAEQGNKADSAIQSNTTFTYGEEQKTIQDLMDIVKAQADTIINLIARIEALENPITTE